MEPFGWAGNDRAAINSCKHVPPSVHKLILFFTCRLYASILCNRQRIFLTGKNLITQETGIFARLTVYSTSRWIVIISREEDKFSSKANKRDRVSFDRSKFLLSPLPYGCIIRTHGQRNPSVDLSSSSSSSSCGFHFPWPRHSFEIRFCILN